MPVRFITPSNTSVVYNPNNGELTRADNAIDVIDSSMFEDAPYILTFAGRERWKQIASAAGLMGMTHTFRYIPITVEGQQRPAMVVDVADVLKGFDCCDMVLYCITHSYQSAVERLRDTLNGVNR